MMKMEDKEILENNKMIADFMGLTKVGNNSYVLNSSGMGLTITAEELKFHSSWGSIIPVVKNCWDLLSTDKDFQKFKGWYKEANRFKEMCSVGFFTNDIEIVFNKVVECIKRLNENKIPVIDKSKPHPLVSEINDDFILTNHEEGTGTGVLIFTHFNFKKELKEINIKDAEGGIDWLCKYHKIYYENGVVMNIEAIKDDKDLSEWLHSFDDGNPNALRKYKY